MKWDIPDHVWKKKREDIDQISSKLTGRVCSAKKRKQIIFKNSSTNFK